MDREFAGYSLSDDRGRLDLEAMHAYLSRSYWAEGVPLATLRRAVQGSLCIGIYEPGGGQVGLGRFVSDFATFCYVCDVYVLEEHRGRGLASAMLRMAMEHPQLQGLRRWNLVTRDAHPLYLQAGFSALAHPDRHMERLDPDVYLRAARSA